MEYGYALTAGKLVMEMRGSAPVGQIVEFMGNTLMMNSMLLGTIRTILKMTGLNAYGEDETNKCWNGKYLLERGEEVKVRLDHPFGGRTGIVNSVYGTTQFGVIISGTNGSLDREITVWVDMLELLPVAIWRRLY